MLYKSESTSSIKIDQPFIDFLIKERFSKIEKEKIFNNEQLKKRIKENNYKTISRILSNN